MEKKKAQMVMSALSQETRLAVFTLLIDAGDVVVHLFRPEVRTFYNLERMWAFGDSAGAA